MVLSRLFSALFANGVVLVATSNVAPDDLYHDGLNRGLFQPFIALLKRHADIMALDSPTDYRLEMLNRMPVYMTPLSPATDHLMDEAWKAVTGGLPIAPAELVVKGRHVPVPLAAGDVARFDFADLCEKPLGARDYLAIAARYSTILVDRVPVLAEGRRNEAKRFILLIDTLYDRQARLILSAEASPEFLYAGKSGNEAFEFKRTASRLIEMQGTEWLKAWAKKHHADGQATKAEARQLEFPAAGS
jgi:cell division protein ZapE